MEEIAKDATGEDSRKVTEIVARATGAAKSAEVIVITPGMAAILFLHHNTHNRTWSLPKIREYQRRINLGAWKFNSNGAGFFTTGAIADMQHRLAAHALCEVAWEVTVTYGVDPDAADTMDCGDPRGGDDAAGIKYDVVDSSAKLGTLKGAYSYFYSIDKDQTFKLRSPEEKALAIKENDAMLTEAIELGKKSRSGVTIPQFKQTDSAILAFIHLKAGVLTREKILEHLQRFQTGVLRIGENEAHFAGAKVIADNRSRVSKGKEKVERLTAMREYGIVVTAIKAAEAGLVPSAAQLRAAVQKGKSLPDPRPE